MVKKFKRNVLLMTGLAGSLIATSVAGVALSSCTTTSSTSDNNVQYSYVIDWSDPNITDRLTIDENGLVYSDSSKTTLIALSPSVQRTDITIPASVQSITGYAKVVTDSSGTKTYQSVGAFQDMNILTTITLATGSKLRAIGGAAFYNCVNLTTINGDTSNLEVVGASAFYGCSALKTIDLSNVITIGAAAFTNALTDTTEITLTKVERIGLGAFNSSNLSTVNFSGNTSLVSLASDVFRSCANLAGTIDLSGCTNLSQIDQYAFAYCTKLEKVYIPSEATCSIKTVANNSFDGCTSLTTFGPQGTAEGSLVTTTSMNIIGAYAFRDTNIKIIDASKFTVIKMTYAGDGRSLYGTGSTSSFKYMHYVTKVILPEGMERISSDNDGTGYFTGVGDKGDGFDLVLPSSIIDIYVWTNNGAPSAAPFMNSGLKSIDMSKITSYNYQDSLKTTIISNAFWKASMLQTVVLKNGTTAIENYAFSGCSSLKWITNANEDGTYTTPTTNGYVAASTTTSIGTYTFQNAFAEDSNAVVDLSNTTLTTVPQYLFDGSNVKEVKLPKTITTIDSYAFRNTAKLTSVNFTDLTELSAINTYNFSGASSLANIDLSNTVISTIQANTFTGLATTAVVSLPATFASNFSDIFTVATTDGSTSYAGFSFPKGISATLLTNSYISNGTLQGLATATSTGAIMLKNLSSLNLASNTAINSVGVNTFFGNTKLTSLTLNGSGISSSNIFTSAASGITANADNKTATSGYAVANIPFGNNTAFTSLNYSGFTANEASATATTAETLFNTTKDTTWNEVAKIINSLSYQASPTTAAAAAALKPNMSTWTVVDGATSAVNTDAAMTWAAAVAGSNSVAAKPAQITVTNSFKTSNDGSSADIVITAETASATIVHNGVVWTYTNDGTNITLKATNVNMYKATNGSNSYLTFFNESAWKESDTAETTYYVPATQSVSVTLTIATASTSAEA